MAYGLYLTLDQDQWFRADFSATNKLTGTIYTDINQQTPKTLTGYTLKIRMHRPKHFGDFFNKTASIENASNGTWSYAVVQGGMPPRGIYYVKMELTKSGDQESTLNRVELHILEGPSG